MDAEKTDPTGAPAPVPAPPAAGDWQPAGPTSDQRNWAMLAHLSAFIAVWLGGFALLGPLVVWLVKKDGDAYVGEQARQALNFNIGVTLASFVGGVLFVVLGILTLGLGLIVLIPVAIAALIAWGVIVIKATMAASRGESYTYPFMYEFIS